MAIGIKYSRSDPKEDPELVWKIMIEYVVSFKDKFGAVNCR